MMKQRFHKVTGCVWGLVFVFSATAAVEYDRRIPQLAFAAEKVKAALSGTKELLFISPGENLPAAPPFIQKQFGPFGPQPHDYPLPAEAIYCAPDGLEANSGDTVEAPTTLKRAVQQATTGSTVVLRGGTYRTGNIVFRKKITIQPYQNEQSVIKGSLVADQWEKTGDHWKTEWKTLFWKSQEGLSAIMKFSANVQYLWNKDLVFVDGSQCLPVPSIEELGPGKFFVDYEKSEIHLGENPEGKTVEITAFERGFIREHTDPETGAAYPDADPEGPTIQGLVFMQYPGAIVEVLGKNVPAPIEPGAPPVGPVGTKLLNNRFLFSGSSCVRLNGTPKSLIAGNEIAHANHTGMVIYMAHHSVFEHNIVRHCNPNGLGNFPAGIKLLNQSLGFIARNNFFHGNKGNALWYDIGHREGLVMNNYFSENSHCLKTEISHRISFVGNVAVNSPLWIVNVANNQVFNNTFINSTLSLMRNDRGMGTDKRASFNHNATGPGIKGYNGQEIANNVFVRCSPNANGPFLEIEDRNTQDPIGMVRLLARNLFAGDATPFAKVSSIQQNFGSAKDPIHLESLGAFEHRFGDFTRDCVERKMSPDDVFEDPSIGDFRLREIKGLPEPASLPENLKPREGLDGPVRGLGAFGLSPKI